MDKAAVLKEKDTIISQIRTYSPLMRPFFEIPLTLREFSEKLYDFPVHPIHRERQKLVISKIEQKLETLFGKNFKRDLQVNLRGSLAFNIADHHQPLSHPFLLSANVISSVNKFFQKEKHNAIMVISSGDVPPNNYFSRSGFILHGKRVPLFSVSEREFCTYYIPKRNFDFVERLKSSHRWHEFDKSEQDFLQKHEYFLNSLDFSKCKDYADQITMVVKNTWPLLFEQGARQTLPELLYVTQEEIVTQCLIDILKQGGDNIITAALFDPEFRQRVLDNFRGIVAAWREDENKGTHFFWHKYPGEPRSIRMFLQGDVLVPQHEKYKHIKVPLEKDALIDLLQKRKIYPGLFLIFSVLCFYSGVRPLTGFGSTVYLALLKEGWLKSLQGTRFRNEIDLVKMVDVTGLVAGLAIFFKRLNNGIKALYAHDIFCGNPLTKEHLETVFNMKYADLLSIGAADMYDYFSSKYIPPEVKIDKTIDFNDIASVTFDYL
ncbi:MAG: hypothetical protein M1383_04075 [Patescibacteria group bacterium]|nr:hypothetical protein [Patescibacteria group bacterium]